MNPLLAGGAALATGRVFGFTWDMPWEAAGTVRRWVFDDDGARYSFRYRIKPTEAEIERDVRAQIGYTPTGMFGLLIGPRS